jgi:hypothetical protein
MEELLHEALIAPRAALIPLPDTRIIDRPGWFQLLTPSLRQGGLNEVVCSNLPSNEADAIIDTTLAEYRRLKIAFRWTVPPGQGAEELSRRLAARGLLRERCRAMWRATEPYTPRVGLPAIAPVSAPEFTDVMARGWNTAPGPMLALHTAMEADPQRRYRFHVARSRGAAVGAAASVFLARSAYLIGAVVLPEARGQGAYRALVAARLGEAFAEGRAVVTTLAREATSAPILERLGFGTAARIEVFRRPPPPAAEASH